MKQSVFREQKIKNQEERAKQLYRTGLSTREIGGVIGKSHTWVWLKVRDLNLQR